MLRYVQEIERSCMDGPLDGREVGERLFEWLEHTGQTTVDLAEQEGMSRSTVSGLLNARTEHPHLSTVRRLARHFGVTVEEFLAGPEEVESPKDRTSPSPRASAKWDAALENWAEIRIHARADVEREVAAFEADRNRAHLEVIGAVLQEAYDAVTLLWNAWRENQTATGWEEVGAADRFYRELFETVQNREIEDGHLAVFPEGPQNQRPGEVRELATA
jgi:transcriptional regulator with XRE-family HTH domain